MTETEVPATNIQKLPSSGSWHSTASLRGRFQAATCQRLLRYILLLGVMGADPFFADAVDAAPASLPLPPTVATHHQSHIGAETLSFTATAGFLPLSDPQGTIRAEIFYVSYILDRPPGSAPRPLLFAWNGGPGSNSSQLHLGALGPKRTKDAAERKASPDASELVDNQETWLRFADVVMVDPVGTGYSYAPQGSSTTDFFNAERDALSIAEFIRVYLHHNDAEHAPLFIAGESYGTFRAARVASALIERGTPLRGVILVSCVLKMPDLAPGIVNAITLLPSLTATGWAHRMLAPAFQDDLQHAIAESEAFATGKYAAVLLQGDAASKSDQESVSHRLEELTGVKSTVWLGKRFELSMDQFARELLPDKTHYVAHYDTRLEGTTSPGAAYDVAHDPSLAANGIADVIPQYLKRELHLRTDAFYAGPFGGRWPQPYSMRGEWAEWDEELSNSSSDHTKDMAEALSRQPSLQVFVASGYFDLSTPFFLSRYSFDHMELTPEQHGRVQLHVYRGGHMMYLDPGARVLLFEDVSAFVRQAATSSPESAK